MKYRAVLPDRNSNVSDKSPLKEFLVLLSGLLLIVLLVYALLGLIIDYVVDSISTETEIAMYRLLESEKISELLHSDNDKLASTQALLDELLICAEPERFDLSLTHYFTSHPQALKRIEAINALGIPLGYKVSRLD